MGILLCLQKMSYNLFKSPLLSLREISSGPRILESSENPDGNVGK